MRNGPQQCPSCGTVITYEDGEMVDARTPEDRDPCRGCLRLLPILETSARRKAALPPAPEPEVPLTPSAILERIRPKRKEPRDWALAAAGDRE